MTQSFIPGNLFSLAGLGSLPHEQKVKILQEATELVEIRALAYVYETLPEDTHAQLEQLIESRDTDAFTTLLLDHKIDFLEEVERIAEEVKRTLVSSAMDDLSSEPELDEEEKI